MKIAINTRLLLKDKLEGIGWYIYENFSRIAIAHPEHTFYFLFDRAFDNSFLFSSNIIPVVIKPPTRHPVLQYIWFEIMIPAALKKINPDLFISPDNYNSLSSKYKNIMVIHDLNFEHYPEFLPLKDRWFYRHFTPKYARKADHIITVSNYSANDIQKQYKISKEKITTIYNGANNSYRPLSEEEKSQTINKYTQGIPYFIFIGSLHPRKNISRLFSAFEKYKKETKTPTKLLVVGEKMFRSQGLKNTFKNLKYKDDIIFLGRKEPEELTYLLGSALSLTFTPIFEGFGIPVIEAFKSGVPVITSQSTSLPEVCGDSALLVNPFNTSDIAEAMKKITFDKELRKELIRKGKKRASAFSWDKSAEELWNEIEKLLITNQN